MNADESRREKKSEERGERRNGRSNNRIVVGRGKEAERVGKTATKKHMNVN